MSTTDWLAVTPSLPGCERPFSSYDQEDLHQYECGTELGYNGKQHRYNLRAIHRALVVDESH
jgi:hypothetical protein